MYQTGLLGARESSRAWERGRRRPGKVAPFAEWRPCARRLPSSSVTHSSGPQADCSVPIFRLREVWQAAQAVSAKPLPSISYPLRLRNGNRAGWMPCPQGHGLCSQPWEKGKKGKRKRKRGGKGSRGAGDRFQEVIPRLLWARHYHRPSGG